MKSRTQGFKTSTTKDAIAHQELWQQIPKKTQETVSGGGTSIRPDEISSTISSTIGSTGRCPNPEDYYPGC